ncbi:MAG: AMP-binding protein [Sphaerochaetaceae bacterium]|nr:AMP-binding protein [Sphaerochaetaceae bacterium]
MKEKVNIDYSNEACQKIKREDGLVMTTIRRYTFRDFVDAIESKYNNMRAYTVIGHEDELSFTYSYLAKKVRATSQYLLDHGIKKGDKVCIFAESSPLWMIFYLGLTSIGGIAVPILPGFSSKEATVAMQDSCCKAICVQKKQFESVQNFVLENKLMVFRLDDLFHIPAEIVEKFGSDYEFDTAPGIDITRTKFNVNKLREIELEESDIASIIYTSGTTGASKGVVLTHMNLLRNADRAVFAYCISSPGWRVLSILPMSHVYEFSLGHLLCLMSGFEIYFLGRPVAVSILLPALKSVRPNVMMTVPLIIEKVYKNAVAPLITNGGKYEKLYNSKLTRKLIARIIGKKLMEAFGGELKFFGIGGAALDIEVMNFLTLANFPYALGYGLTETSPHIAGNGPKTHCYPYVGKPNPDADMKLIDTNSEGVGEIVVKGPQVMGGYYNNDELNKESFTEDGYFRTGDLGFFSPEGYLMLKGRIKTMILGPAGENIYPEQIESVINNMPYVEESLVLEKDGGLAALIRINEDLYKKIFKPENLVSSINEYVQSLRSKINSELSSQNRIDSVEVQKEEFKKTSTQKIKRFLYTKK